MKQRCTSKKNKGRVTGRKETEGGGIVKGLEEEWEKLRDGTIRPGKREVSLNRSSEFVHFILTPFS